MVELQTDAQLNSVFHALADPTRRAIISHLSNSGESTISELSAPFSMSFAAVSKHIRVLERAGIVERQVRGRQHFCRMHGSALMSANDWLAYYAAFWQQRLDALGELVDGGMENQNTKNPD